MKTRNLIFLCLLFMGFGFMMHGVIFPGSEPIMDTDTIYVHSVSYDTIYQDKPVPVEIIKYVPKYTTIYEPVPVYADTALILAQYFEVKMYDDVLKNDSTGYIRLKEKVHRSQILDRELYFESRCKDKIITNTISQTGLYGVASLGVSRDVFIPSVGVLYLNDKARLKGLKLGYTDKIYIELSYGFRF